MATDREFARALLDEYVALAEQFNKIEAELRELGRTDVPLNHPEHINNAGPQARAAWFDKYKTSVLLQMKQDTAMRKAFTALRRLGLGEAPAED